MTRLIPTLHERHAPIALLDAFYEAILAYDGWTLSAPEPTVRLTEKDVPISSVFGRMRTSDDIVPEKVLLVLGAAAPASDDPSGRSLTYAQVAAHMRALTVERLRWQPEHDRVIG